MNDLSDKIKLLRSAQNLNQTQLAELVGITQPFLSDIEKGKRKPSIEVLQKLCDALGCSADYLLSLPHSDGAGMKETSLPGSLTPEIIRLVRERNITEDDLRTALKVAVVMREDR